MPFDLHITFAGLCLFVPDKKNGQDIMHVLLPSTEHGHGGGVHRHLSRLLYDRKHDPRKSASGASKRIARVSMRDRLLDLTHLRAKDRFSAPKLPEVVSLYDVAERRVERALLDETDTGGRVVTRVTLATGIASVPDETKGGTWKLGTVSQRMATAVKWTITEITGDFLELELEGLNEDADQAAHVLRLEPVDEGGKPVINLWLYHSPSNEFPASLPPNKIPTPPNDRAKAEHFAAYYSLTGAPVPIFQDVPAAADLRGDELHCIVATAPAE